MTVAAMTARSRLASIPARRIGIRSQLAKVAISHPVAAAAGTAVAAVRDFKLMTSV